MLPSRPLLALSLLLLGGLAWSVAGTAPPTVPLEDAARWEGQDVTLEGWATAVQRSGDGTVRLALVDGTAAVAVRMPDTVPVSDGDRLALSGRLTRSAGRLTLFVEDEAAVLRAAAPEPVAPGWDDLAARPDDWVGRRLALTGTVERGHLVVAGHGLQLGMGDWPRAGPVRATGLLRYDPACLCHVLDAGEVHPWTS